MRMNKDSQVYRWYLSLLCKELVPALGCTEPIAIAYASAKAAELLGAEPEKIRAQCSGNIIKNVKAVIVPKTGDLRGIEAGAVLGAVGGDADKKLEVLQGVTPEHLARTKELLAKNICTVELLPHTDNLHIIITAYRGEDSALVEIKEEHTNITHIEKNGVSFYDTQTEKKTQEEDHPMSLQEIYQFAGVVDLEDVSDLLEQQISYNTRIAEEGLSKKYGANVGATLLECYGNDVKILAKAYPAAGSDARMSGCTLPVVINSGSGNQGMTVSLPVIKYAEHLGSSKEQLYRALVMSNLTAIHQKKGIGRLSAYCGVVSAAAGSGAGIAYLHGADLDIISKTVVNTLANVSGIVCDGAKPSCAAKIASSVDAAVMGYLMAEKGRCFRPGEGIVKENAEKTIASVTRVGRDGMRETDTEILNIMVEKNQ